MTALVILAAAAVGVAVLVGLLRLAKAATDRLVAGGPDEPVTARRPLVAAEGWINEDEPAAVARIEAVEATQLHDLDRLNAAVDVMQHRLNVLFERTLRDLGLSPDERVVVRTWARLASDEYPLVGVR